MFRCLPCCFGATMVRDFALTWSMLSALALVLMATPMKLSLFHAYLASLEPWPQPAINSSFGFKRLVL